MSTTTKYNQSETKELNRSLINFAPYNPRVDDPKVVETLKRNFKKVAFLGGLVWNKTTGNLISGHKRLNALDLINRYKGTTETDYVVKVEVIELDEKTEKEQNIFMNADAAQGVFDFKLLADIIPDIDYKNAGLTDSDIEMIELEVPTFSFGNATDIIADMETVATPLQNRKHDEAEIRKDLKQAAPPEKTLEEKKAEQIEQRREMREEQQLENSVKTYVTLSFSSAENKLAFMNRFGFDATAEFIKGESFSDMIERIN